MKLNYSKTEQLSARKLSSKLIKLSDSELDDFITELDENEIEDIEAKLKGYFDNDLPNKIKLSANEKDKNKYIDRTYDLGIILSTLEYEISRNDRYKVNALQNDEYIASFEKGLKRFRLS